MSPGVLALHHDELLEVLRNCVVCKLDRIRASFRRKYEDEILLSLQQGKAPDDRYWPRAIHNKYQWWANANGNVCQGTLYRSAGYLALGRGYGEIGHDERYGGKGEKKS